MNEVSVTSNKTYAEVASINVSEHVEKKNGLSYLSWSWAVDQLLRLDENAMWSYGTPQMYGDTMMIYCTVEAFGRVRTAQLPVMDYKNKPIANPDAFAVNTAMQRCLAKAIALHGLGLYIYSGEDLPQESPAEKAVEEKAMARVRTIVKDESEKPTKVQAADLTLQPENVIMIPEAISSTGEAACVDFIVSFTEDFIMDVKTIDGLRDFWKINKAELSRVQRFSKPTYETLEEHFKQRATVLKGEKK